MQHTYNILLTRCKSNFLTRRLCVVYSLDFSTNNIIKILLKSFENTSNDFSLDSFETSIIENVHLPLTPPI